MGNSRSDPETEKSKTKKKFLDRSITTREVIFLLAVVFCLSPLINPPLALLMGLIIAQFIGHPYLHLNHKATHILLQVSFAAAGEVLPLSGLPCRSR